uniref:Uncharacterized protein n=1 Tax=Minutocellus polymorphus TaxID=265543 RepID=A0A7S0AZ76_9STRA|mmetsp:Transcript_7627/g.12650  ORF Transcript_7627/g.12650 Transcript_7627/m.12650 type:complete len:200 (+) Transcript_7627:107-706(+)|eukprot:CAMPEP_0197722590 /NCGR_PEP_ID=MMETSP1434-20131217/5221_1 /TAXON_ID=265543 /ORGANISM="Minutocellus polymorphus, Strain CCMP3303" /LENGTH=199 /DNA_ID=CAMNT_0043307759 /DNA_START=101 /DNA_END=700 /DNA_ORIENTATION=+
MFAGRSSCSPVVAFCRRRSTGCRGFASASAGGPERTTASAGTSSTTTFRQRLARLRSNGTPEIVFGVGLLTLLAADQLLQSQQEAQHHSDREAVLKRLQYDVDADMAKERSDGHTLSAEEESSKPSLFQCRVMTVPKYFDGTKSLMGVEVGDVVEVLEEQVGPGGTYNLCRLVRQEEDKKEIIVSVGWYPMSCLEKIKS